MPDIKAYRPPSGELLLLALLSMTRSWTMGGGSIGRLMQMSDRRCQIHKAVVLLNLMGKRIVDRGVGDRLLNATLQCGRIHAGLECVDGLND